MVNISSRFTGALAILSVASSAVGLPTNDHDAPHHNEPAEAGGMVSRFQVSLLLVWVILDDTK